jgi:ech hydrogenase subunit D
MADFNQVFNIELGDLVPQVLQLKHSGNRLVQICAVRIPQAYELMYSFAKDYKLTSLKLRINEDTTVMSISDIYSPAFLYENEIHELFGVKISLISLDYGDKLYRIDQTTPFK